MTTVAEEGPVGEPRLWWICTNWLKPVNDNSTPGSKVAGPFRCAADAIVSRTGIEKYAAGQTFFIDSELDESECGAVDRTGQRRCVLTPGHHEVENWTSHGDRGGWTWNDQPAED